MDQLLCEVRFEADTSNQSPGRLIGTLVTYEERARDRPELFARGALDWPTEGILINLMHDRQQPLLRAIPYLDGDELRIAADLPDTQRGRDVATDMRQALPVYTGLSVEFRASAEGRRGGLREIRRAYLPSAGLVDRAAYAGSRVEIRSESGLILPRAETLWL